MKVKSVIIIIAVLVIVGMYWTRYQIVELAGVAGYYKINRLTGSTELIAGVLTQPVKNVTASQADIQRQRELRDKMGGSGTPGGQNLPTPGEPAKK